ncbi:hypothetical protein GGR50DRAFT_700284 [Xylaria sp. CBS 124048]|nr:hypothetical protein GGR50DRAFT_700284 [Xylaria sp. CBS 124048]
MSRHDEGEGEAEGDEQVFRPSRYRSLRKRTGSATTPPNTKVLNGGIHESDQQPENAASNTISRTMSRYRRYANGNAGGMGNNVSRTMNPGANGIPPVPANPALLKAATSPPAAETQKAPANESYARRHFRRFSTQRETRKAPIEPADDGVNHFGVPPEKGRGPITLADQDPKQPGSEQRDFSWEAERDRRLEEQKKRDLQRLEEELENSRRAKNQQKRRSPVVEKLVLLAKGGKSRNNKDEATPGSPVSPVSPVSLRSPTEIPSRSRTRRFGPEPAKKEATHIEPGGKGIVPQKDAPTSAVNAGERNVAVRWQQHILSLPVTPETTTLDIIAQTASKLRDEPEIRPDNCLVIERYGVLGLERRLRRYERIRDVMNSWDRDTQNQLVVIVPDPTDNHEDLDVSAVADCADPPLGCQLYMYHSNRPGKWNKRWITLLASGQILSAKKPNAHAAHKDTTSLCHLSDYDIYMPTEAQLKKHIKPPKRICFAIKSQHKTTLFLNTENYVQYFSIEDPLGANEFQEKVHGWRSRYLVDRRPEVREKPSIPFTRAEVEVSSPPQAARPQSKKRGDAASIDSQRPQISMGESPYPIGQFKPLLDMSRFDKRLSEFGAELVPSDSSPPPQPKEDTSFLRRFSRKDKVDHKPARLVKRESKEIFTGGLLGDEYDIRKQALADLEKNKGTRDWAFTNGASLSRGQRDAEASGDDYGTSSWFPSALEHTAKKRVPQTTATQPATSAGVTSERLYSLGGGAGQPTGLSSSAVRPSTQHLQHPNPLKSQMTGIPHTERRGPGKPLVDLTPTVQEPPQWSQDKKGHGVKPPEGQGHLVNFISPGKSNRQFEPPPRTLPRQALSGSSPMGRTRSMSSSSATRRPLLEEAPPLPLLPQGLDLATEGNGKRFAGPPLANESRPGRRATVRDRDREEGRSRHREREREHRHRDHREREGTYNSVPGRTGTLKVV